jgi:DNA-binding beta-propeller fold protein YncE
MATSLTAGSAAADLGLFISPPTVTVGAYPESIAISPDGSRLFVVNSNPFLQPDRQASLAVIDTATRTVTQTVWLGTGYSAEQIAVVPDGSRAYVANASHLDEIDLATFSVHIIQLVPAGEMSGVAIAQDGKRAYVTDRQTNQLVTVNIDPQSGSFRNVIATAATTAQPYAVGVTPDGTRVYVGSGANVDVFETATNMRVAVIPLNIGGASGSRIPITPDGRRGYVALDSGKLAILDTDPLSATFNQRVDEIDVSSSILTDVRLGSLGTLVIIVATSPTTVAVVDANPSSPTFKSLLGSVQVERVGNGHVVHRGTADAFAYAINGGQDPGSVSVIQQEAFAGSFVLHRAGATTLFLDGNLPSNTTAKSIDSASVAFSGGNPWKEVGTWVADPSLTPGALRALGPLQVWLGLKNSDDQGTRFDVQAEVRKNSFVVATGLTRCVAGLTRNPNQAAQVTIAFNPFTETDFDGATDTLSVTVRTRIGTNPDNTKCPGHNNAAGLRLYFDSVDRQSQFSAAP